MQVLLQNQHKITIFSAFSKKASFKLYTSFDFLSRINVLIADIRIKGLKTDNIEIDILNNC